MRRLEHPVRARARDRRATGDRDEPTGLPFVRTGVEGDGLSDREGRGQARSRLHARRDPKRSDRNNAGKLRADARLCRRQVSTLRIREVSRCRCHARDADEVRRRSNGDRPDLQGGVPQSGTLTRARRRRALGVAGERPSMVPGRACRPARPARARLAGGRRLPAPKTQRLVGRRDRRGLADHRDRGPGEATRLGRSPRLSPRRLLRG